MPGNPLVRFDEGRVGRTRKVSPSLLLYRNRRNTSPASSLGNKGSADVSVHVRTSDTGKHIGDFVTPSSNRFSERNGPRNGSVWSSAGKRFANAVRTMVYCGCTSSNTQL